MSDPSTSTSELLKAMPALEASLGALKEKSWEETTDALGGLDRAKIDVLLSYAINDLIWVYLKLKGIDPATHDVSSELERIRKYYTKIKSVEDPPQRTSKVDVDAARRFITHSIPRSQRSNIDNLPSTSAAGRAAEDIARIGESGDTSLAGRFRFIAKDAEKVVGEIQDSDDAEGEEEEKEGMDVDADEGVQGDDGQDAEAFMKDFEMELEERQVKEKSTEGEDQGSPNGGTNNAEAPSVETKRSNKSKGKKKRRRDKAA